jgi:hypothetical protein
MEARKETRGDSCWSAFEYQALVRDGGSILSRTDVTDGGEVSEEVREAVSSGETGRETT